VLEVEVVTRVEADKRLPLLVVRLPDGCRGISSAVLGGGLGPVGWVLNAHVEDGYDRLDPARHLADLATEVGLVGMLSRRRAPARTAGDGGHRVGHGWAHPPTLADRLARSAPSTSSSTCKLR
jgi:hypothetical protein